MALNCYGIGYVMRISYKVTCGFRVAGDMEIINSYCNSQAIAYALKNQFEILGAEFVEVKEIALLT